MDDVRLMLRAVLHDDHTGDQRAPSVEDHLRTLAVTAAIEASAVQGARVHLPSFAATFGMPIVPDMEIREGAAPRRTQSLALSPEATERSDSWHG